MRTTDGDGGDGCIEPIAGAKPDRDARAGRIDAGRLLGEGIQLFFTDRDGGVSPPPYDTLNLAYHTGDVAGNVSANRDIVATALGMACERFIYLEQVHGIRVVRAEVSASTRRGTGDAGDPSQSRGDAFAATDGVYTTEPGLALGVLIADCVPLAIAVPDAGVVAMLHAGWRGTIGDIAGITLKMIAGDLEFNATDACAVMGPAIGSCCYEVDEGRARLFVEKYGRSSGVVSGRDGHRLDLFRANHVNLREAGVKESNISRVGGCTCCEKRYYSFRRDGETGRQGAFVVLG